MSIANEPWLFGKHQRAATKDQKDITLVTFCGKNISIIVQFWHIRNSFITFRINNTNLIDGQIDSSIWNDAKNIWNVSSVEAFHSVCFKDVLDAVIDSLVLTSFPNHKSRLDNLK